MKAVSALIKAVSLLLSFAGMVAAQTETDRVKLTDPELVRKILNGDNQAVIEAGRSGNTSYIPILKHAEQEPEAHNTDKDDLVSVTTESWPHRVPREIPFQLAVAKLGDVEAQQHIFCRGISELYWTPNVGAEFSWKVEYVGGWYGIKTIEHFLSSNDEGSWEGQLREYNREVKRELKSCHRHKNDYGCFAGDTPPPYPPVLWALVALSKIVPDAPVKFDFQSLGDWRDPHSDYPKRLKSSIAQWQAWIAAHKMELSKLEPTGEGVDFSPQACKGQETNQTKPIR